MKVNVRKPLRLKNTSKYWNRDTCKTHVTFSSPSSYQSFKIKQEGYETRLYWQFKYCEDNNGQTFYYTLTYNDAHIPKYLGFNCFDYEDLRALLTGGFRKILLRHFGTKFKYFIGAELGDGKGERGMHNNPHYHVLFFLEDAKDERFPYKSISPYYFRHLIRMFWQGFDEDVTGFQDYRTARFGIAREGDNIGKVTDFRACVYCAKYVTKDAGLKLKENDVERLTRLRLRTELRGSAEFHNWFFRGRLWKDFNVPLNAKNTEWLYPTANALIWNLLPHDLFRQYAFLTDNLTAPVLEICRRYDYWKQYNESFKEFLELRVKDAVNEYRNRYCNKPRISHGVGDYALSFIGDKLNPTFQVPDKDGFKNRPMSMYYYRKLFTEVHIDKKGSPIRILNKDGIDYKVNKLQSSISKMAEKASSNISLIVSNKDLFEKMRASDVNVDVTFHHSDFLKYLDSLQNEFSFSLLLERYAQFKLVYEDRFFPFHFDGNPDSACFPDLNPLDDYRRFLEPSFFSVSRSDVRLDLFLSDNCPDSLPYTVHPYFNRFVSLFRVFDLCADYFFIQGDIWKQKEAEGLASVKRFHDKNKLKNFYSQFSI